MERKGAKTQGKGEGWKIGRVEEGINGTQRCKDARKRGRMEDWKGGKMEGWKGAGTNLIGRGQVQDLPLRVLVLCPL